jgi:hypothetical protein
MEMVNAASVTFADSCAACFFFCLAGRIDGSI